MLLEVFLLHGFRTKTTERKTEKKKETKRSHTLTHPHKPRLTLKSSPCTETACMTQNYNPDLLKKRKTNKKKQNNPTAFGPDQNGEYPSTTETSQHSQRWLRDTDQREAGGVQNVY